ncbi:hypothetical protein HAX54_028074, partial [Datura stramonium]|nr:hypothetical protein [Datura stramonium]
AGASITCILALAQSFEDDNLKSLKWERAEREQQKRMRPANFQSGSRGCSKPRYKGESFVYSIPAVSGTEPSHGTPVE